MDYRRKVLESLRVRCVHLKTKSQYVGLPERDARENDVDTAVWWCERTCEPLGPDHAFATRRACEAPGRSCYEAPGRRPG